MSLTWTKEDEAAYEQAAAEERSRIALLKKSFAGHEAFTTRAIVKGWSLVESQKEFQKSSAANKPQRLAAVKQGAA